MDTLLQTKLFIPQVRSSVVSRPHLTTKLNQGLNSKLTLVAAPAGFGKTTLVAEFVHHSQFKETAGNNHKSQFSWLSLDENDNDPIRFLAYFIAALQKIESGIGDTTLALLQSPQRPPPEAMLTSLLNEIASNPTSFMIALDDYHVIQNPAIHQQLTFLLENQSPQMHLIILTREDPPLPLARLRARGQITEIRQEDLRFTPEETAVFLQNTMALNLTLDDIAALERRTEGWIAGLQLAALSMKDRADPKHFVRAFTGSNRFVLDYLMEEVFDQQSPAVQDFLLKTSILDRLSVPLCDAITGSDGSQQILQSLDQANLFIVPLDQSRRWFRYHRLFAELLHHRLQTTAGISEAALHKNAACWYETNGDITEAVNHTLAAQDWEEAERMITLASAEAVKNGQFIAMQGWLERLPAAVVNQSADLSTFKSWALFFMGDFAETAVSVEKAMALLPADAAPFSLGSLTVLRASLALYQFDIPQAIQLSQKTLAILGDDDPYFLRGMALHNLGIAQMNMGNAVAATEAYRELIRLGRQVGHHLSAFGSIGILAGLLNLQGQRREAIALCRQALGDCVDSHGRPLPFAGSIHINLGLMHQEENELDLALEQINMGIKLSESLGPAGDMLNGLAALARLQQAMGQGEMALATVQEIRQATAHMNVPYAAAQVAGIEADIRMKQGNIVAVAGWAKTAGLSPNDTPNAFREPEYFTFARLLLAQNRLDEAHTLLTNFELFAQEGNRTRSLISIYLLQAQVAQARGHQEEAAVKLEQAVRLAAPENYQRAFIEDGQPLFPLLLSQRAIAPAFIAQFQTASAVQTAGSPVQPLPELLSERELEILALAADGLTNREIAERAFISVGTVKSHIHHILDKLDVGNRTQAVARARELGLL